MPDFFKGIGGIRMAAMAGFAAALTAFFLYIAGVITTPPQAILFSGLEARDAAAVTAKLQTLNVAYEQKGDGGTILVPADQVLNLRMQLASDGLPSAGVGYEIFDKSDSFGTTAFVQNINRLRALEGELVRTIRSIDTIKDARVHLVVPDRQVFSRDNQPPSASVMIKSLIKPTRGQVAAIQHLVASAVSGLSPGNVAIVDDKGDLLAGGASDNSDAAASASQEERSSTFENRTRERVETIVASIVGAGHVRAQVSAQMDFNKVTQSSETYDPDSRVVRSSQTVEQNSSEKSGGGSSAVSVANALPGQDTSSGSAAGGNTNARTEETVNYEISKKTTTEVMDSGTVKRLSIAVVVDGTHSVGQDGKPTYTPRSAEDMTKITDLVKSAIGYDQTRGDTVQVTNMRFADLDVGTEAPAAEPLLGLDGNIWLKLGEILILSITALLVGLLIVRPMIYRLIAGSVGAAPGTPALAAPAGQAAPALAYAGDAASQAGQAQAALPAGQQQAPLAIPKRESMIDISQIEGQVRESAIRKVGEVVGSHPEEAMAILRTWLHQPS